MFFYDVFAIKQFINLLAQFIDLNDMFFSFFTSKFQVKNRSESKDEIAQVMDDLRAADVDFLTIGQYLQPTIKHHAVIDYITPELFNIYRDIAISKGFLLVSSSPFTRSSYHADEDFQKLKIKRNL